MTKKEKYPYFRYYLKSKHPALITGETKNKKEYNYHKVTHSEKDGKRNNIKIYPNPNKKDKKSMYISKRKRHDYKENFSFKYN